MPRFTIDLTAAAVQRLQALVTAHNQNTGQALTVQDWLTLLVKERAIADELAATADQLRRQAEADATAALEAAVKAERDRLLATL